MMIEEAIERYKAMHAKRSAELEEMRRYAQTVQKEIVRLEGGLAALQQLKHAQAEEDEEDAAPINGRSDAHEPATTAA